MSCPPPCPPPPCPPTCKPPPCAPVSPPPCKPICPPPPPCPPCRSKPVMKGLHWAQTQRRIAEVLAMSAFAGSMIYIFLGTPRRHAYAEYYRTGLFDDQAEDMANKGLFQAVNAGGSMEDNMEKPKC